MNFHSKNESTKTQVCLRHFSEEKKKKTQEVLLCGKEKGKMQFMEIAIFTITSYLQCSDNH